MNRFKIKINKNYLLKAIITRLVIYSLLLFISAFFLYEFNILLNDYLYISYILSAATLLVLTLISQYLIFAITLNKTPSFEGFKEIFVGDSLDNPIKFLFPEFDLFYKLEESVEEKIDFNLFDGVLLNSIDEKKALQIEEEYRDFIANNLNELLKYDIVIKMKRKGKAIFDDLTEKFPLLEKLVPFTDPAVYYNVERIKDRNLLIFDDSIHHSKSAREILNLLKVIGYKRILFLTVISQEDSLESLKRDYPESENIFFLQYRKTNEEGYKQFYADFMIGYLDHVNRSLENDHTLIKLKINALINKEDFIDIFQKEKNYVYEVERFVEKENEYKISVECPWIYDMMKKSLFNNIKMDMVKVRFFVKLNQPNEIYSSGITDINLSPALIPHEFNVDFCTNSKIQEICNWNKFITNIPEIEKKLKIDLDETTREKFKDFICIECLINSLTNDFVEVFMKYFETKLKETKKAFIIEKNINFPFPQEHMPG